ncbi:MAG: cytochrome c biogenesis CcdA family protein [Eubacterium sp.]|nr:cytochrome c biogenesis CcdA family protein [Eubacterium sp.]
MQYFITFIEGIITFISPCLLPLLPVYISFFAGGKRRKDSGTLINALGFVLGFTIVFVCLGAFAGSIGHLLTSYQTIVNIVTGAIVIFFGLTYLGVFPIQLFRSGTHFNREEPLNFFTALIFGITFSISWTPCIGTFLGSALMLASQQAHVGEGILLLLLYSAGLGIPYVLCAVLINRLKSTFDWIKKHYQIINRICGILLIVVGFLMACGLFGRFMALFQ